MSLEAEPGRLTGALDKPSKAGSGEGRTPLRGEDKWRLGVLLALREIAEAICRRDDHFAIDDRGAGVDLGGVGNDFAEAFGPVVASAGNRGDFSCPTSTQMSNL